MQAAGIRDASGRVIVALMAAGRSSATIERHEVEFNAFAGFLEARGRAVPTSRPRRTAWISSPSGPG
jgi:hypothetical protein